MKSYSPTSPSRRQMTTVSYASLTGAKRHKPLTKRLRANSGRNNRGVITMRHQGGGQKKLYRTVDFKQDRFGILARIESVEYDPYRNAFIALVIYRDGLRTYVLAYDGAKVGGIITTDQTAPILPGNRMQLKNIPVGTLVHNVETRRGGGGVLARAAGGYVEVLAHEKGKTDLKMASKEVRKVSWEGLATIGQVSNPDYNLTNFGKAGRSRWLGVRPTVRGSAMNPVDHKYGGGEGAQPRGTRRPKDIWGNITGGKKTRNRKKYSKAFILQRRPKIR